MVVILARITSKGCTDCTVFSVFSLYIVLCYGFGLLSSASFTVVPANSSLAAAVGQSVELLCRADTSWEWCRCCMFNLPLTVNVGHFFDR